MKTFEELGVSAEIRQAIEEMGYENPMPVQEEVIPYLLGNRNDVVALAQTGTGKTGIWSAADTKNRCNETNSPSTSALSYTRALLTDSRRSD